MDSRTVGILGGGQLGKMIIEAAHRLGINVISLDPAGVSSPAGKVSSSVLEGSFRNGEDIKKLAELCDIITTEIEHIDCGILDEITSNNKNLVVRPTANTISIIQDKFKQKIHFKNSGINLPQFMEIVDIDSIKQAGRNYGYPFVLKSKKLAYDGRGNKIVNNESEVEEAFHYFNDQSVKNNSELSLYAEEFVNFSKELSVMVVRSQGKVVTFPVVETIQQDNICRFVISPANIPDNISKMAQDIAKNAVLSFGSESNEVDNDSGIYGVELFYVENYKESSIILNEIAPRPHNSGHFTMQGSSIDQFEMHLRAILDLPIPSPQMNCKSSVMVNVLGGDSIDKADTVEKAIRNQDINLLTSDSIEVMKTAMNFPTASIHWYSKEEARLGRKIAHFNIHGNSYEEILETIISHKPLVLRREILQLLPKFNDFYNKTESSIKKPIVSIIMGSDSDLPLMKNAALILEKFGVPYELSLVSAHRTPLKLVLFSQEAADRGIKVIIAGAGGAAHLPGMVAALTTLPVIGVPVPPTVSSEPNPSHNTSYLGGLDALLSIVQMPRGVPVATMSIGNSVNAALLAIRIIAIENESLRLQLVDYIQSMENEVEEKDSKIQNIGWKNYLTK